MKTFQVEARPAGEYWELDVVVVGTTQARSRGEAEAMVRDYRALRLGPEAGDAPVTITQVTPA